MNVDIVRWKHLYTNYLITDKSWIILLISEATNSKTWRLDEGEEYDKQEHQGWYQDETVE